LATAARTSSTDEAGSCADAENAVFARSEAKHAERKKTENTLTAWLGMRRIWLSMIDSQSTVPRQCINIAWLHLYRKSGTGP
jgi:hypothetical protein